MLLCWWCASACTWTTTPRCAPRTIRPSKVCMPAATRRAISSASIIPSPARVVLRVVLWCMASLLARRSRKTPLLPSLLASSPPEHMPSLHGRLPLPSCRFVRGDASASPFLFGLLCILERGCRSFVCRKNAGCAVGSASHAVQWRDEENASVVW